MKMLAFINLYRLSLGNVSNTANYDTLKFDEILKAGGQIIRQPEQSM